MPRYADPDRSAAIGARICIARITAGMSTSTLAGALRLSGQQINKYEQGTSRLPAVMLDDLGRLLGRPALFFIEMDDAAVATAMLLALPEHPVLRRQIFRAVAALESAAARGAPAGDAPVGEAAHAL